MSKNRQREGRKLKETEAKLWKQVVSDVTPANTDKIQQIEYDNYDTKPISKRPSTKTNNRLRKSIIDKQITPSTEMDLVVGKSISLDRRTAIRLRRGKLKIENRLDLHGYNQQQAQDALRNFVENSRELGQRCVLVITGKGSIGDSTGVLRRGLPNWINQPDLRHHVLAIEQAQSQDGGLGAYYLLLRRQRDN
ncbi:MAG: hypothetical protein CMD67_00765 [Gammaproteobacteria bacterium]|jgi:DNA-nicking Smr family endonuclease|nr:hypothetical protein [Gammaproteobacteria bacterium]